MTPSITWKLRDTVLLGLMAVVFGIVYLGAVWLGVLISSMLTPLGLAPLANEPICGIWFMAGTFGAAVLRKPGAAVISEIAAALVEVFLGSFYGPMVFVDGLIQGIGAEFVFLLGRYRNYSLRSMCLAGLACALVSFSWELFRSGFLQLEWGFLAVMLPMRAISGVFFAGVVCSWLAMKLREAGILRSFEPAPAPAAPAATAATNAAYQDAADQAPVSRDAVLDKDGVSSGTSPSSRPDAPKALQ